MSMQAVIEQLKVNNRSEAGRDLSLIHISEPTRPY